MTILFRKIRQLGEMVKFSHSIFALPFALSAALLAEGGFPSPRLLLLILGAMVTARNAGVAFNRYLDAPLDARNPRTADRHIPRGILSRRTALVFSLVNAALFMGIASQINGLCFWLSFPTIGWLYFYSFTKRFTYWSHLVLGLALGSAPVGAWIAITGEMTWVPVVLGTAVLFWVAGFDVIYATQDIDFDYKEGLHSLVVKFGLEKSLRAARGFHVLTVLLLFAFGQAAHLGWIYKATLFAVCILLIYEHSLVSPKNLSRVNAAFFNVNGFISLLFLVGVVFSL